MKTSIILIIFVFSFFFLSPINVGKEILMKNDSIFIPVELCYPQIAKKNPLFFIEDMSHLPIIVKNTIENQAPYYDADFPIASKPITSLVDFIQSNG